MFYTKLFVLLLLSCTLFASEQEMQADKLSANSTSNTIEKKLLGLDPILISDSESSTNKSNPSNEEIQKFFVVGDFGDLETKEDIDYVTNLMDKRSELNQHDFMISTGDNVYENGIEKMSKLDDVDKIMSYFQKPNLKKIPMYLTLGNHDCYSDYKNEIEYSSLNEQWNMESDYYTLTHQLKDDPSKKLVLLMLNSCLLPCKSDSSNSQKKDCKKMGVEVGEDRVNAHYEWLEENLKIHSEDPSVAWLGLVQHHPVLIEPTLKRDFLPLLAKYNVDILLVGHKHMFEYANYDYDQQLKYPDDSYGSVLDDWDGKTEILNVPQRSHVFSKGSMLHQFIIGSSGRKLKDICPYKDQDGEVYFQSIEKHGFASVKVDSTKFQVKYFNDFDSVIFDVTIQA